jgi:histidinol-phosphate aminotransferase/imidazoleglycerol-phosphate dehydratase/histidinol-phosphatase
MTRSIVDRARPDILAMNAYSSARSLHKARPGMVFLDANECSHEPFVGAGDFNRYPDQQPGKLVDALCRLYDISSRNLSITRGADEAIAVLIQTFCRPGQDNIIVCPPTFPMYRQSATVNAIKVLEAPLTDTFALEPQKIREVADDDTKIIFICSPNNPTANLMDTKEIRDLCAHFDGKALVVVDETYIEFAADGKSMVADIEKIPNLVVLRTLSKSYAAAGLRCGVALAAQDVSQLLLKVLAPYPVPQPVAQAALKILTPRNMARLARKREEILERKKRVVAELEALDGVEKIFPSSANFILLRAKDPQDFVKRTLDAGIIVRDFSKLPRLENCIRLSVGAEEDMQRLMAALQGQGITNSSDDRTAVITRVTKETSISLKLNLDRSDPVKIETGIPFYDHILHQVARHGGFSIVLECEGDLDVEEHHTIEDCAIALGQAFKEALDSKAGIARYGSHDLILPMDEAQAKVALDLGGRFYLVFKGDFPDKTVGNAQNPLPVDMVEHIFRSFAENLQANLHIEVTGRNTHHMVEACFKGLGIALKNAVRKSGSSVPSTKGVL